GVAAGCCWLELARARLELLQGSDQTFGTLFLKPDPGRLLRGKRIDSASLGKRNHGFRGAAVTISDDRRDASLGLDWHEPEVFFSGEEKSPAASIVVAENRIGLPTQEMYRRAGQAAQTIRILTRTDDDQLPPQTIACRDRQVQTFIRGEG